MPTLITVTIPSRTGIARDSVVNNFVVATPDNVSPDFDATRDALAAFYNDSYEAGIDSIASRLSSVLSRTVDAVALKFYNLTGHLDGSPHGSPVAERFLTLDAAQAGHNNLPGEAALVVSLEADMTGALEEGPLDTRPKQRRRGRVYLGPLNDFARSQDGTTGLVQVNASFLQQVGKAADALKDTLAGIAVPLQPWAIWSRTDAVVRNVVRVKVDNEIDTQRRRGARATVRTTFN